MKQFEIRKNGTLRVFTINNEISKADQSAKKECDVNHIVKKYKTTGLITHLRDGQGSYLDLSEVGDLSNSLNIVASAQQKFDQLPAELRKRFGNSPVQLVEFLSNSENDLEAVKLGLKVIPEKETSLKDVVSILKESNETKRSAVGKKQEKTEAPQNDD